ncbi:MAG: hypothetical protein KatS3mg124_2229 [Porticoccaceae bacterium]|nr:MAG: hypothetical protein KatS3mg124_2229 [Porticoccaceae bacterium]
MTPTAPHPIRQLFANRQFRWLWAGNTAMFFGFFGTILLRSLLAWELTGDELALAWVNLLSAGCMFATSLVSGALIDRHERRRFLLVAQCGVLAAEATILALLLAGRLTFPLLLISSTAASIAFPFIMPARTAMLVAAVGRARLGRATAFMTTGINLARMASPAALGILADAAGFPFCYGLILFLHAISILCTLGLDPHPPGEGRRDGLLADVLRGFVYLRERPSLALCILFGLFPLLVVVPLQNLMVVFVDEVWQRGGSGLGLMMAATGIGGVVGSLATAGLGEGSLVKPMVAATLVMAALVAVFAHLPWFWLAVAAVFAIYATSTVSQTLVQTGVQLLAEDHIRGRVTTITMMSVSIAPVGTLLIAVAVKHFGAPWTLTATGALLAAAILLLWRGCAAFRAIDGAARRAAGEGRR